MPTQVFSGRVVAGLAAAGIFAFAAFMILLAYAGDYRSGRDGRGHALSGSAIGFRGLVDLIGYSGREARLIRTEEGLATDDLVVVTLEPQTDPEALSRLVFARGPRPTLIVLPKWGVTKHPVKSGWVNSAGTVDPKHIASLLNDVAELEVVTSKGNGGMPLKGAAYLEPLRLRAPEDLQTVAGEDLAPMLSAGGGNIVLAQVADRPLFILSDPDILNNHGLKDRTSAAGALALLDELNSTGAEAIGFDLTLNGFARTANILKLAFEPPFVALTLALFFAALLAGLHGAVRFGPERREERAIAFGKAALVENSAGLIKLARREHRVGAAYADILREEAAHATGAPAALRGEALDAYLDGLSPPGSARFTELADRAAHVAHRDDLVTAARALFQWKRTIIQ